MSLPNPLPLSGITVLELANVLAGPGVGAMLSELGATVIKVENLQTQGDVTRTWKLPTEDAGTDISAYFSCVNWGKKSLAIDLSKHAGQALIHQLTAKTDIVIASYKPGDAEKLHMDYATLSAFNPSLIYAHLTGYGLDNERVGYDAIIQAETGFTLINGEKGCPPVKMPVALMDVLAGHHMKEAILLALYEKSRTGKGNYIDVSLFRAGISSLANQATNWLVGNCIPKSMGSDHPNIVPYGTIYHTSDQKPVVLAVGTDAQFRNLCEVLGISKLADDQRFATNPCRVQHRADLHAELKAAIANCTRDELLKQLRQKKVPAGGVFNMKEVFEQAEAQPMMLEATDEQGRQLKGVSSIAFWMKGHTFANVSGMPPHYGAHSAEILRETVNLTDEQIQTLIHNHVIYDRHIK